jgi:hypothetical protein
MTMGLHAKRPVFAADDYYRIIAHTGVMHQVVIVTVAVELAGTLNKRLGSQQTTTPNQFTAALRAAT